jgi:hypothetical protein
MINLKCTDEKHQEEEKKKYERRKRSAVRGAGLSNANDSIVMNKRIKRRAIEKPVK